MKKILFLGEEEVGKRTIINLIIGNKTFPGFGPITVKKVGNVGTHRNVILYSLTPKLVQERQKMDEIPGTSLIVAVVTSIRNCVSTKKAMDEILKQIPNAQICVIANKQDGDGMDPTAAMKLFNLATIGMSGKEEEHKETLIEFLNEFL